MDDISEDEDDEQANDAESGAMEAINGLGISGAAAASSSKAADEDGEKEEPDVEMADEETIAVSDIHAHRLTFTES